MRPSPELAHAGATEHSSSSDPGADGGSAAWPFELMEELGGGATAQVYRATVKGTGDEVALKVGRDDGGAIFAREAEVLAAVHSQHLPGLVAAGRVPLSGADERLVMGRPYLAMTWMRGVTLSCAEPRSAAARHALALVVARDVGQALADVDAAGVAHGDVKPANIQLLGDAVQAPTRAALIDLGLADDARSRAPAGGTLRYLGADAWSGAGDGRARDCYALGLVLAEILDPSLASVDDLAVAAADVRLPQPFDAWCHALLSRDPGARPRASWIAEQARRASPAVDGAHQQRLAAEALVRSAYLGSRRAEISHAARAVEVELRIAGPARTWVHRAIQLTQQARALGGEPPSVARAELGESDELARARWLVGLVGGPAARWPVVHGADSQLANVLCELSLAVAPGAWTFAEVDDAARGGARHVRSTACAVTSDAPAPVDLAIALAGEGKRDAIAAIERDPTLALSLKRAAADALRRMGQAGRALALLAGDDSDVAHVARAEVARRAGDVALAEREALAAIACGVGAPRATAVLARLAIDRGDPRAALALLVEAAPSFAGAEARALALVALGERSAAEREIARAEALADTEEARGRAAGLLGYVAHQSGDIARAARGFARAAEHAVRADAWVEEATYLTGAAAAQVDDGDVVGALESSRRASLLWEHLARPRDAARALLARAAAFSLAGARLEAAATAHEAGERARVLGDVRAQAFACWAITDAEPSGAPPARDAARQALALLSSSEDANDRLRAHARLLRHAPQDVTELDLSWGDETAADESTLPGARLDWWRARIEAPYELAPAAREHAVRQVCLLWGRQTPLGARGPAFAAAATLAKRIGDGDASRLLTRAQSDAARALIARAPSDLGAAVRSLPWVASATTAPHDGVSSEQIAEFETLVRALGARDRLRPLLEQILDSLILWTGVERGLLLLVAPNGKLVPRAARNLARGDLEGEQKALSHSLAQKALALGDTVVAVDAAGEMPSVHASVHALKLRSVLAIPLIARGQSLGVVYLDDRVRRGAFGPRELSWVKLVATLAALAVADARDQIWLRRTARRAQRAKQALADELARREAELDVAARELSRREELGTRYRYDAIIGRSAAIQGLLRIVDRVTSAEVPVLVIGESGSGKELVARAIHANGPRRSKSFVSENCAAVPEPLLESTLFGHVRGAFTGADRARAGWFEIADGGTLFLDEIGEMSLHMQARLLRVLEEREVHPLGSERARKVDVRVIAATHRDLAEMVTAGTFREDLYYRLHVISVRVPPLRERRDDIALLVHHFLEKHAPRRKPRVSVDAMNHLRRYGWPGNVRQLENEVRRAIVLSDDVIETSCLSLEVQRGDDVRPAATGLALRPRVDALEAELVQAALAQTHGNQTKAAELLGLSRFGLQKMMKRLGVGAT